MTHTPLFIDADAIITERPSGIGSMTINLIHALSRSKTFRDQFRIVLFAPFNKRHHLERWGFDNVQISWIPLPGRVIALLVRLRIMPPIDLFLGKGIYLFPNFRNMPLLRSKSITYIHDVSFRVHPDFVEEKNLAFLQKNISHWISRTNKIVTVSNNAKNEITKYYPDTQNKITVVYNGIDDSFHPLKRYESEAILLEYGIRYKEYFMFLSNIEPRKNIEGLLEAYELFLQDSKNQAVKLLLVGGMGWKNERILKKIAAINRESERIILPKKYVPDHELPSLLSGAAALIHPAHYEGFGISPLQAMACGTQLVVANNTSLPEVVKDGGEYVSSRDVHSIHDAMKMVYNKRYQVNVAGINRAKQFTWDSSAKQLTFLLRELEKK